MAHVLLIEDEAVLASALAKVVGRMGHQTSVAASAAAGLERYARTPPDLVVLDIGLPDRSGIDVLAAIRARSADVPVVVITAHGNLGNAVEARKRGASSYLVKPLDVGEFERTLATLLTRGDGPAVATAKDEAPNPHPSLLIGSSAAMQPAFAAIAHACASDVPVLITGPTGIGKSLTARIVHVHSARHDAPFVTLTCAGLADNLLESELFGHERGAFTGADTERTGHVERAAGGTLFLDEIGEISPQLQVKLLRFVEEKTFVRVGGRVDRTIDVRILAATNRDLEADVRAGRFREDLYYRLRVLEVRLPPLSARTADLPALCAHLLPELARDRDLALSAGALARLRAHPWPGNVRELRNALEHAAAVCAGPLILESHLPESIRGASQAPRPSAAPLDAAIAGWVAARLDGGDATSYADLHDDLERRLLATLLPRYGDKPTLLARSLGMNRATLRRKLRDLGLASADTDADAD